MSNKKETNVSLNSLSYELGVLMSRAEDNKDDYMVESIQSILNCFETDSIDEAFLTSGISAELQNIEKDYEYDFKDEAKEILKKYEL